MKKYRILLVVFVFILSFCCLFYMNRHFDSLSRYPYHISLETKKIIKDRLNYRQQEYIIEWSISPDSFLSYLKSPKFNIYHLKRYNFLKNNLFYLSDEQIVDFSETLNFVDEKVLYNQLSEYYYTELVDWYYDVDKYNKDAILVDNPNDYDVFLNDKRSVGKRYVDDMEAVDFFSNSFSEKPILRKLLKENLKRLCQEIDKKFNTKYCGYQNLEKSFISFEDLKKAYEQGKEKEVYGHSYYQLGLAFQLAFDEQNNNSINSDISKFIDDNCYKYGIINIDKNTRQYRFVGEKVSSEMKKTGKSFEEIIKEK